MNKTAQARLTAFQNFVIAGSAASLARASVNGFSVLKIRNQVGVPGYKMGPIKAVATTWRLEGFGGFFKGLNAAVMRSFIHIGIQFTVFDQLAKRLLPDELGNEVSIEPLLDATLICGGTAGLVATLCTHPLDLLKTRLVVQGMGDPLNYKGIQDCFGKIVKSHGVAGLYRGLIPSLMGSFFVSGNLFSYWYLYPRLNRPVFPFELAIWLSLTTTVFTYPFDMYRRNMMSFDASLPKNGRVDVRAESFSDKFSGMSYSLRGNYCGITTNLFKLVPQLVVFWLTYQILEKVMLSKKKKGFFIE